MQKNNIIELRAARQRQKDDQTVYKIMNDIENPVRMSVLHPFVAFLLTLPFVSIFGLGIWQILAWIFPQ